MLLSPWTRLRYNLLLLVCARAPHLIQSQLNEVMTTVVYCDYPEAWTGLLEAVMSHLTSNVSGTI